MVRIASSASDRTKLGSFGPDSVRGRLALTPAQWLPKPATVLLPHKRRTLRNPWSPREREARQRFGFGASWGGDPPRSFKRFVRSRATAAGPLHPPQPRSVRKDSVA